jgi:hypothetical protein
MWLLRKAVEHNHDRDPEAKKRKQLIKDILYNEDLLQQDNLQMIEQIKKQKK